MADPTSGEVVLGLHSKLYYGAAGSQASTQLENVQNVRVGRGTKETPISRRMDEEDYVKIAKRVKSLAFTVQQRVGDTQMDAIEAAHEAGTRIALYAKSHAGGVGPDGDWYITKCDRDEPEDGKVTIDVEAKPSNEQRDLTWH